MDCDSERIWKIVENQRHNVPRKRRVPGASLSLSDRLYDCYVDCLQRQSDKNFDKRFRNTSNLLQQLPAGQVKPSLVVNLYSDERGYSLVLSPDKQVEEVYLPYEDDEIFSYLDNQEIPPVLVEVLSETSHCHMYGGCVVCEVRNHRNSAPRPAPRPAPSSYDSHLLMLKPTTESVLQMVNELASETGCSLEDQLVLESRLLLATQPPICLDPSTEVVWVTNRLHYNSRKFHSPSMRRYLRRRSQARRARMHHSSLRPAPPELRLHNFLKASDSPLRCPRTEFADVWKKRRGPSTSLSGSSLASVAKKVQELAMVPHEPPPTPTTPTSDHTPLILTPPLHPRAQGQTWAEEFLHSEARQIPPPVTSAFPTTPPRSVGGAIVGVAPPTSFSLPPPIRKAAPTIVQSARQPQQIPLPTPTQPPLTHSLTISLPRHFYSHGKTTPTSRTIPATSKVQASTITPSHPPTSLPVISRKKRPIPAISTPPVAMTAGRNSTPRHPTAATRSSVGVITPGNRRPVTTTQVVGVAKPGVGKLTPPKLYRPPHLPTPTGSTHRQIPLAMPKLHRLATPSPHSTPGSAPSVKTTPPMPVLRPLALENGSAPSPPKPQPQTPPKLKRL